jgi:hypothetical protein
MSKRRISFPGCDYFSTHYRKTHAVWTDEQNRHWARTGNTITIAIIITITIALIQTIIITVTIATCITIGDDWNRASSLLPYLPHPPTHRSLRLSVSVTTMKEADTATRSKKNQMLG